MINDTISDMLTRIRNANMAKHDTVEVINSKTNLCISDILEVQGYIESFEVPKSLFDPIKLTLKYIGRPKKPCITNLKRLSSPGLRLYARSKQIPRVFNGMGILILSTSQGLMTDNKARKLKLGGELMCSIW